MTEVDPRQIQWLPLDALVDDPTNPKAHSEDLIDASMGKHGVIDLITTDDRTGYIVSGHGRTKALRTQHARGDTPPEGVRVADDGTWLVPVVTGWASTDDLDAAAVLIKLNRLTELGGWVDESLLALLDDLRGADQFEGVGFTEDDLDALRARLAEPAPEPLNDPDDIPEPAPGPPTTQRGDVWELGPHRIMCGDSRDSGEFATLMDGATINLAFTSPPYASQRKYDESSGFEPIHPDRYVEWFGPIQQNVRDHLAVDGSWFVNIKAHCEDGQRVLYVHDLTTQHVRGWGWKFVDEFCWYKTDPFPGHYPGRFKNAFEPVLHFATGAPKHRPENVLTDSETAFTGRATKKHPPTQFSGEILEAPVGPGQVWPSNVLVLAAGANVEGGHAALFPVRLPSWFIRAFTDPDDVVYDPFMGAGSTLIAAHDEQRIGYGMEISPGYVDTICRRFQQHTGIIPTRNGEAVEF